jgi:hypothetical protein
VRRALLIVVLLAAATAPLARADADPASDFLLGQPVYASPIVPAEDAKQLTTFLNEVKAKGYTLKVALIASRTDLGGIPVLFRKPKVYARFLGQELTIVYHGPVLVVMPNGLAVSQNGKLRTAEQEAIGGMTAPGRDGAAFAPTAARAVSRLAALHGVHVAAPTFGSTGGGGSGTTIAIVVAAAVVLVLLVVGAVLWRRRVRR